MCQAHTWQEEYFKASSEELIYVPNSVLASDGISVNKINNA
jgi:hypothetical protein